MGSISEDLVDFFEIFEKSSLLSQGGRCPPWTPPPLRGGPAYRPGDYPKSVGEGMKQNVSKKKKNK